MEKHSKYILIVLFLQEMIPKFEYDKLMERHSKDILIVLSSGDDP